VKRDKLQRITKFLFKNLTHSTFIGTENIPPEGGVIFATNHMSRIDIALLFINPVRKEIQALVADSYSHAFLISWFSRIAGAIWIDRSKADFSAFREAIQLVKSGVALGIAPEGTRSKIGELLEGKPGAVLLAEKADVVIVPVGLEGTDTSVAKLMTFRKPVLKARFGKPFKLPPIDRKNREVSLQRATDEVMCRIAALLPERYWGFYRNHPRLLELLLEQGGPVI